MKKYSFMRFLCSIPIILLALYFIPPLGVCLVLVRYFAYSTNTKLTPIVLFTIGLILLIPKGASCIGDFINYDMNSIPHFNDLMNSEIYNVKVMNYSKLLIIMGVVFTILNFFFNKLVDSVKAYFRGIEERNYEIAEKNDLKIKEKQEEAKNTQFIRCPNCGANNVISGKTGTCKYCRQPIQGK